MMGTWFKIRHKEKEVADGSFMSSQRGGQHTCFSKLSLQLIVTKAVTVVPYVVFQPQHPHNGKSVPWASFLSREMDQQK